MTYLKVHAPQREGAGGVLRTLCHGQLSSDALTSHTSFNGGIQFFCKLGQKEMAREEQLKKTIVNDGNKLLTFKITGDGQTFLDNKKTG